MLRKTVAWKTRAQGQSDWIIYSSNLNVYFQKCWENRCLEEQGTRAEWQNAWNNNAASTFAPAFVKDDPLLSNIKKK